MPAPQCSQRNQRSRPAPTLSWALARGGHSCIPLPSQGGCHQASATTLQTRLRKRGCVFNHPFTGWIGLDAGYAQAGKQSRQQLLPGGLRMRTSNPHLPSPSAAQPLKSLSQAVKKDLPKQFLRTSETNPPAGPPTRDSGAGFSRTQAPTWLLTATGQRAAVCACAPRGPTAMPRALRPPFLPPTFNTASCAP